MNEQEHDLNQEKEIIDTNNLWLKFLDPQNFDPEQYPAEAMIVEKYHDMVEKVQTKNPDLFAKLRLFVQQQFEKQGTTEWERSEEKKELDQILTETYQLLCDEGFEPTEIIR